MKISKVIKKLQRLQEEFGDEELFVIKYDKFSNLLNDREQFAIKKVEKNFIFDWREKEGYNVPAIIIKENYII